MTQSATSQADQATRSTQPSVRREVAPATNDLTRVSGPELASDDGSATVPSAAGSAVVATEPATTAPFTVVPAPSSRGCCALPMVRS